MLGLFLVVVLLLELTAVQITACLCGNGFKLFMAISKLLSVTGQLNLFFH